MPLQDLTPQLRTRLSRLERLVGLFITAATLLLLVGLSYYVYQIAQRKGWFLTKMPYFTFVQNAAGLRVGDRIKLMGFDAGEIVEVTPMPPDDPYFNVYIRFRVNEPYYGYLWADSRAKIGASDFLGNRFIEVTKGSNSPPTYPLYELREISVKEALSLIGGTNKFVFAQRIVIGSNQLAQVSDWLSREVLEQWAAAGSNQVQVINLNAKIKTPEWIWNEKQHRYSHIDTTDEMKGFWLKVEESPALTERLDQVINTVEQALPGFLSLTNQVARVLTNAENISLHTDDLLVSTKPVLTNLAQITANLNRPQGALGEWLIPTNLNAELQNTLQSVNATTVTAQTNLAALSDGILASLINVANLTSNLNAQVQGNGLMLNQISDLIVHTDELMQGLKRHWLLRGAFGESTNQPVQSIVKPSLGGSR